LLPVLAQGLVTEGHDERDRGTSALTAAAKP
jgi:hypothetical protein